MADEHVPPIGERTGSIDVPQPALLPASGLRSFVAGTREGKFPWGWRWLGVPLLLGACMLSGWWAWGSMERNLDTTALAHLTCENVDTSDLSLDWSYRDVTIDGRLPAGVSAERVQEILGQGSTDAACLEQSGIGVDADPGIYDVKVLAAAGTAAATTSLADADDTTTEGVAEAASIPDPTSEPPTPEPATPEPVAEATPIAEPAAEATAALAASAAFDGEQIRLVGDVGDEAQRQALVDAAVRAVGVDNVVDELTIVDGIPSTTSESRIDELVTVLSQFANQDIIEGTASVDDEQLTFQLVGVADADLAADDLPGRGTIEVQAPDVPADDSATADEDDSASTHADEPAADVTFTG